MLFLFFRKKETKHTTRLHAKMPSPTSHPAFILDFNVAGT